MIYMDKYRMSAALILEKVINSDGILFGKQCAEFTKDDIRQFIFTIASALQDIENEPQQIKCKNTQSQMI